MDEPITDQPTNEDKEQQNKPYRQTASSGIHSDCNCWWCVHTDGNDCDCCKDCGSCDLDCGGCDLDCGGCDCSIM